MMQLTPRTLPWLAIVLPLLPVGIRTADAQSSTPDRPPIPEPPQLVIHEDGHQYRLSLAGQAPIRVTDDTIRNARAIRVPGSATVLALWEEVQEGQAQPYYAVSLTGQTFSRPRSTSYDIKLRHGDFDPAQHVRPVSPTLAAPEHCELWIVQFVTPPLEVFREQIRAFGGTVYSYLADHAHIVRMSPAVKAAVEALPYVRWVGPYHPAYRLESQSRVLSEAPGPRRYRIQVFESGAAQKNAVADRITALGGTIDALSPGGILLEATLTPEQLLDVAGMNEVLFIDRWSPPRSCMNNVRIVGGADYVESLAGYTGAGVRGEVMDDGCQLDHPDFAGRIEVRGNPGIDVESHGTATFGIIFGSGAGSSTARGMLPDAFGYFNDWVFQTSRYDDIAQLVTAPYNCVFQSNSWGHAPTTEYTTVTAELDQAVFDFDIVILHSQGNEGTQMSVEQAWGKNVVGVGGVYHYNDSYTGNDHWLGAGSIGPAADGRIKPDLCFYYESIRTTTPISTYTNSFGGTSAACPEVAGHFGLVFQMWADGIFGNPVSGGTVFEEKPHNSTARAILINTARSYPFSGTTHDLTRTHQGWGLPNVQDLYDLRNNMFIVDETVLLQQFDTASYQQRITTGQPNNDELRATLVYTDYWGTTSSSQHRINDLSLKVTSPSGLIYWGNDGLLSGNWSVSGGTANTKDTIENVFISNPESGNWVIEVMADEINADGHTESGQWDVDFALVVSGGVNIVDCNDNGVPDDQDIAGATSEDCNGNGLPDECEIDENSTAPGGPFFCTEACDPDCNNSGTPDECDVAQGTSEDCNADIVPDECQLDSNDCNGNSIPDDCEPDCSGNDIPDDCDIAADPGLDLNVNGIPDSCEAEPRLESGVISVGDGPVTVPLNNTYDSPVVVCSVQYDNNTVPVVTRVSNVTPTSFDVRLQNPSGDPVTTENVSYLVIEEGVSTIDGVEFEAWTYNSTVVDVKLSWVGELRRYHRSHVNPVVLGQVMSENDPDWSVFWCQGATADDPPSTTVLRTGKHVGADLDVTRAPETIGVVVTEAGHSTIGGVGFESRLGEATVQGVDNTPPYPYLFDTAFATAPTVAVVSQAGMVGADGSWAQTYGPTLSTTTALNLSLDEDQLEDTERRHAAERVAYAVFEAPLAYPSGGDGDFDLDGDVDLKDFGGFQVCFDQSAGGGCQPGDMNGDDFIDAADIGPFVSALVGP